MPLSWDVRIVCRVHMGKCGVGRQQVQVSVSDSPPCLADKDLYACGNLKETELRLIGTHPFTAPSSSLALC